MDKFFTKKRGFKEYPSVKYEKLTDCETDTHCQSSITTTAHWNTSADTGGHENNGYRKSSSDWVQNMTNSRWNHSDSEKVPLLKKEVGDK